MTRRSQAFGVSFGIQRETRVTAVLWALSGGVRRSRHDTGAEGGKLPASGAAQGGGQPPERGGQAPGGALPKGLLLLPVQPKRRLRLLQGEEEVLALPGEPVPVTLHRDGMHAKRGPR